jgi:hypothetical protein
MKNTESLRDTKAAYKGNNLHTLLKTNEKMFHAEQSGIKNLKKLSRPEKYCTIRILKKLCSVVLDVFTVSSVV